jgi:hypothetical protein
MTDDINSKEEDTGIYMSHDSHCPESLPTLSQTSQLIEDFEQFIPELGQLMLELEAAP